MKKARTNYKQQKKNVVKRESALDKTIKSSFLGILITVGIGFSLMLAATAAALLTDDPTSFVNPAGHILPFICAFIGGIICSKLNKTSPYLTSMICGVGFFLVSMLSSFVLPQSLSSGTDIGLRTALHFATLLTFPLGTLASVKTSKKPKTKFKNLFLQTRVYKSRSNPYERNIIWQLQRIR